MKIWASIANVVAIFLTSFLLLAFHSADMLIANQFDELRLRYALDYATEAAFMSTLEVYDIGIDYTDIEAVNINPSYCLDTFKSLICLNYGMSLSKENFEHIETYIPVAVLLCNDGFYVAQMQELDKVGDGIIGSHYGLHWKMKKPYTYIKDSEKPISENNPLYSMALNTEKWTSVFEKNGVVRIGTGEKFPSGVNRDLVTSIVTKKITEEIHVSIEDRNKLNSEEWANVFHLPSELGAEGINNLDRPALLIMMQGVDLGKGGKVDAVSLGGVKTERKRVVVGFVENGIKYYCYERQIPEDMLEKVDNFYDDVEEAALDGYNPHFEYLSKRFRERSGIK